MSETYNVWLEKQKYANGRTALLLMDEEGQVACATVNLPEHDLQPGEMFVKTWGENERMLEFLVKHNLVIDTGREVPTGYVRARVCKLLV
jgi:hypothetical protein